MAKENKTKTQIKAELARKDQIERQKMLARKIFPILEKLETPYDAETACNALSGYIKLSLMEEEEKLVVKNLGIDFSKEKESLIKDVMTEIFDIIQDDKAAEAGNLLEMIGSKLPQYLANIHMKGPMSQVTTEAFVA